LVVKRPDRVVADLARLFAADGGPPEQLLDSAAAIIGGAEGEMCLIGVRVKGSGVFAPVGLYHEDPERMRRINDTPGFVWPVSRRASLVLASGRPFLADDASISISLPPGVDLPWRDALQESGVFPHVMLAIRFAGESIGMLVVARKRPPTYSQADVRALQGPVDVLALALRDSRARADHAITDELAAQFARSDVATLNERERQIVGQMARGLTSAEIGERLHLSTRTIEWYRARILEKLDHPTRESLVALGLSFGE
jgi:DNA-binding CsgD family transcriptional regulator